MCMSSAGSASAYTQCRCKCQMLFHHPCNCSMQPYCSIENNQHMSPAHLLQESRCQGLCSWLHQGRS